MIAGGWSSWLGGEVYTFDAPLRAGRGGASFERRDAVEITGAVAERPDFRAAAENLTRSRVLTAEAR